MHTFPVDSMQCPLQMNFVFLLISKGGCCFYDCVMSAQSSGPGAPGVQFYLLRHQSFGDL
jgi:hypothetical protein